MAGGLLAGGGLLLGAFATHITHLYLSVGLLAGLGWSLIFTPTLAAVGRFFPSRRSLATGLVVSGSSASSLILASLIPTLLDAYGWRGAMAIMAAISFNSVAAGALMRSPPTSSPPSAAQNLPLLQNPNPHPPTNPSPHHPTPHHPTLLHDPSPSPQNPSPQQPSTPLLWNPTLLHDPSPQNPAPSPHPPPLLHHPSPHHPSPHPPAPSPHPPTLLHHPSPHHPSSQHPSPLPPTPSPHPPTLLHHPSPHHPSPLPPTPPTPPPLLRTPLFLLFSFTFTLVDAGYYVPFVHGASWAHELGCGDRDAAAIMAAMTAADGAGRVLAGWLASCPGSPPLLHHLLLWVALAGVTALLLPLGTGFGGFLTLALAYGFCAGGVAPLQFAGVVELVGTGQEVHAIGLMQMLESSGSLLGAPLAGWLRDVTGTFSISFLIAGCFLLAGSLVLLLILLLPKKGTPTHPETPSPTSQDALEPTE